VQLFAIHNPPPAALRRLEQFLYLDCAKDIENAKQFLGELLAQPATRINFDAFCTIVRIIKRALLKHKDEEIRRMLTDFVVNQAAAYFPYLTHAQPAQFR
jgi:hypothetical protein